MARKKKGIPNPLAGAIDKLAAADAVEEQSKGSFATGSSAGSDYIMVALKDLEPTPNNDAIFPPTDIEAFADELLRVGMQQPIVVSSISGQGAPYRIIGGHRRWRASQLNVERGHTKFALIACKVLGEDVDELGKRRLHLTTNTKTRGDVTPSHNLALIEEAEKIVPDMKAAGEVEAGVRTNDVVADLVGKSSSWVAQHKSLKKLIPLGRNLLDEKKITFVDAVSVAKLPKDEQEAEIKSLLDGGSNTSNIGAEDRDKIEPSTGKRKGKRTKALSADKVVKALKTSIDNVETMIGSGQGDMALQFDKVGELSRRLEDIVKAHGGRGEE